MAYRKKNRLRTPCIWFKNSTRTASCFCRITQPLNYLNVEHTSKAITVIQEKEAKKKKYIAQAEKRDKRLKHQDQGL